MNTTDLKFENGVYILTLTNGEKGNSLTTDVLNEYIAAVEQVKNFKGNTAFLLQCEHEKTFSTGINLEWLSTQREGLAAFGIAIRACLLELATLNVPTICAINGNAYAAGAIISCAFDFRLMREDRGRICFPEVNINIPFDEVTMACTKLVPAPYAIEEMLYTGKALTGKECLEQGIVSSLHSQQELNQKALELAIQMSQKNRSVFSEIKKHHRKEIYALKEKLMA